MNIQEAIEDADSNDQIEVIKVDVVEKIQKMNIDLEKAFENQELHKVKEMLQTLKFHLTILQNINEKAYNLRH
jgi:hypothetical protein